jgi:rhomboid protease GluP
MLGRKTSGSVVCPSCGSLVGVNDDRCYMCGRANPSLWGFGPALRQLGADLGFVPLVIGSAVVIYVLTLIASGPSALSGGGSIFNLFGPNDRALLLFGASGAYPVFVSAAGGRCSALPGCMPACCTSGSTCWPCGTSDR